MPKAVLVKRGEEYMPGVPLAELEAMYRRERPGKSRDRLQAAILRKQDELLEKIAGMMGRGVGTIHRWLSKMESEGPESRHDNKSPGRPRLLNPEQERAIEEDLDRTPRECGFERGSWNGKMVARRILDRFGVPSAAGRPSGWRTGWDSRSESRGPSRTTVPRRRSRGNSLRKEERPRQDGGRRAGPSWPSTRPPCATRPYPARGSGAGEEGKRFPSTIPSSPST